MVEEEEEEEKERRRGEGGGGGGGGGGGCSLVSLSSISPLSLIFLCVLSRGRRRSTRSGKNYESDRI